MSETDRKAGAAPREVIVRAAAPPDLEIIAALLERAELPAVNLELEGVVWRVAASGDTVLGCAGLERHGEAGLLRSVVVDPAARGQGIGARLVSAIEVAAREAGLGSLFLLTLDAEAFFAARGFETVERAAITGPILESWEFRHHQCDLATAMRKALP